MKDWQGSCGANPWPEISKYHARCHKPHLHCFSSLEGVFKTAQFCLLLLSLFVIILSVSTANIKAFNFSYVKSSLLSFFFILWMLSSAKHCSIFSLQKMLYFPHSEDLNLSFWSFKKDLFWKHQDRDCFEYFFCSLLDFLHLFCSMCWFSQQILLA